MNQLLPNELVERIKQYLIQYRKTHKKTQKEMAEFLGVSYVTYQNMERGDIKKIESLNVLKEKIGFESTTALGVAEIMLAIAVSTRVQSEANRAQSEANNNTANTLIQLATKLIQLSI